MPTRRSLVKTSLALPLLATLQHALAAGNRPLPGGIRSMRGEVWVNEVPAHQDQLVLTGDTVRTGPGSEVVYVMGNNAYLMRDNSTVQFLQEGVTGVLRVVSGKVLGVFGPGAKRIETRVATVGIRGTACYLEVLEDTVYFCLCYGSADIRPLADPSQGQNLTTRHHDSPLTIGTNTAQPLLRAAPVRGHYDSELTLLEATVGRLPPFYLSNGKSTY